MQLVYSTRVMTGLFSLVAGLLFVVGAAHGSDNGDVPSATGEPALKLSDLLASALEQCKGSAVATAGPRSKSGDEVPKFLQPPNPGDYYPRSAGVQDGQGLLMVEVLIDRYGNPRFAHIVRQLVSTVPKDFDDATLRLAREARFKPVSRDGQPVAVWNTYMVSYLLVYATHLEEFYSAGALMELVSRARAGDTQAETDVVHLYEIAPQDIAITATEYTHFLAVAALAGSGEAKLMVSQRLGNPGCSTAPEIQDYLHKVAWRGFSPAELLMATRMLETGDPTQYYDIAILLHGAANSSDPFVQTWATGLLATGPVAEIRDPAFALQTARSLSDLSDPDELEVIAASYAANGQFDEALKAEDQALARAKSLGWNTSPFRARLLSYRANQP